jgi:hypothetical protein
MLLSENIMIIMIARTARYTHKDTADEAHRKTSAFTRNTLLLAFAKARSLSGRILNLYTNGTKRTIMG